MKARLREILDEIIQLLAIWRDRLASLPCDTATKKQEKITP